MVGVNVEGFFGCDGLPELVFLFIDARGKSRGIRRVVLVKQVANIVHNF